LWEKYNTPEMKRIILIILAIISGHILFAQPITFNYQGIARDDKRLPFANRQIALRLSIHN